MSVRASWLTGRAPLAAVGISPEHIAVATMGSRGRGFVVQAYASEPLAAGTVVPSLTSQNISDVPAVVSALESAFDRAGGRPRQVAMVIPDVATKVSLVRFDQVPTRREDLDQLVRWQVKKSTPFPIEEACLTYTPGLTSHRGAEFVVALSRREVIREYEGLCEQLGAQAGLVDLATFSVVNLYLASADVPSGDWLLVHLQPSYTSLVIMRGESPIFFRNRPEGDDEALPDLVHQTVMYYEDRLEGSGFGRVLLGGASRVPGALDLVRRSLEDRLGIVVEAIDATRAAALGDGVRGALDQQDGLAPLVGILLRTRPRMG